MSTHTQFTSRDYSGNFGKASIEGLGAGAGLASLGDALTAAGILTTTTTGAGAGVFGIEAMSVGDALASGETASGPLLACCQQQLDARIIERSAYKLRARMQGDGKVLADDAFRDAMQHAAYAVTLWRAGVTTTRREDGSDAVTAADAGERQKHVARVAWRALVEFLSDDGLGDTVPLLGGAEDDWLCAQMLPSESRAERAARLWIERHAGQRQTQLSRRMSHVSGGRGRRAQAIEKVGNALALLLGGETLDTAALAAGFKARGRNRAGDALLQAANRLGLIPAGFSMPRRAR